MRHPEIEAKRTRAVRLYVGFNAVLVLAMLALALLLTGCSALAERPLPADLYCTVTGARDGAKRGWYAGCLVFFH